MTTQTVSGRRYFTKAWLMEQKSLIALLVLIAIVSTLSPNFFTINNLFNILQQTSVNAIMAVGMTLVILTSGIDLSVGSLLALTGAVAASIVGIEVNALVAVAAALALGAAIGAVTGVIVAKGRIQAFIATLVMMLLLRGVTMVYTNGSPVNTGFTENADLFGWFGIGRPLGVPTPVWIMGIVFLAAWYMLHHTRLGRYIYALGGNEAATRLSGINVNKIKIIVYSLCGLLASLAGIIEVARLSSAQPTAGTGYELDAIAAVVLGGTSLAGGKGRIVGTLIGALILGFLNNGLNLLGVSSYYQMIVKAVVILLAVLVGAALATAGVIMQGLFRNPMADPGLLGVSSGSALMVGVAIVLPFSFPVVLVLYEQMVFAIAGSLVVCTIIFLITQRHRDGSMMQLLLAGIAINALCGAAIGILSYIGDEQQLRQLTLWMMGNLGQAQWPTLLVASSFILPAIIATTCLAGTLNLLQLGDEEAHYLGVNVKRKRQQLLLVSSLLVGAAVSVSGIIGFIGLVIPHLIRMTTGANHRWLIPCSALAGACLLLMADTLARTLVQPAEMPVGLLTSLLGGPYFMWLILRNRRIT